MGTVINHIASDETLQRIANAAEKSNILQAASLANAGGAAVYDAFYATAINSDNIDSMFLSWWAGASDGESDKTKLLSRWFNMLNDDLTFGVKFYKFSSSNTSDGVLLDDSIALGVCTPSTSTVKGKDEFVKHPAFWTVEVNYEIGEDGEIVIKAVDKVDPTFNRNGVPGMVGVAQKSGWFSYSEDDTFIYKRYRSTQAPGFVPMPECVSPVDNTVRPFMVHAKYMAGIDSNGNMTSATNLAPCNYTYSHNSQITEWRKRGANYAGISICDISFRIWMFQLKYAKKGNSSTMAGCNNYNYQKIAAVSEQGVKRILLTSSDASGYIVGSNIIIGDKGEGTSTDRNTASMYSLAKNKKILSIEDVSIEDTSYKAINIDTDTTFDTEAGVTYISTMPWWSGACDNVLGVDGSPTNNTNGKEPFIIQGLETQTGAYAVVADLMHEDTYDAEAQTYTVVPHVVRKAADIATSKTDNYVQSKNTLIINGVTGWAWHYIQDLYFDPTLPELTLPSATDGGAGSSNGYQAAASANSSSGWREWLSWGNLNDGGNCGLACVNLNNSLGNGNWNIAAGASFKYFSQLAQPFKLQFVNVIFYHYNL